MWTSHAALRENVQNNLNPQNKFNFHIEKQKTVDDSLLLYILNTILVTAAERNMGTLVLIIHATPQMTVSNTRPQVQR